MLEIIKALQAGHELADPASWKKGQNLLNLSAAVITGLVAGLRYKWPEIPVTDEQIIDIASVAAGALAIINGFLTTATSKKVGV